MEIRVHLRLPADSELTVTRLFGLDTCFNPLSSLCDPGHIQMSRRATR